MSDRPLSKTEQLVAGAAQLVSPAQRARLSKLAQPLASIEDEPLIDVYVLLGNFPTSGRHRFQQLDRAVALAAQLEADQALGQHLGRVRVLALQRPAITAATELPKEPGARYRALRTPPPARRAQATPLSLRESATAACARSPCPLGAIEDCLLPPHRTPLSLPFHRLIFDLYDVSDDELQVIRGA